jgi:tetratricopeptide (TPR) repeat protein
MGSARLQAIAFALALAGLAALVAGGLYRSVAVDGRAPPLRNGYGNWVNERASQRDWRAVLHALRLSAALDIGEARVESDVIPILIQMARRMGDREGELEGLRSLAERRRSDPSAHNRLASAILRGGDVGSPGRREAASHSRAALALDPGNAMAHLNLGRVALLDGRRAEAFDHWDEAARRDAALAERFLARLSEREAAAVEEFRAGRRGDPR